MCFFIHLYLPAWCIYCRPYRLSEFYFSHISTVYQTFLLKKLFFFVTKAAVLLKDWQCLSVWQSITLLYQILLSSVNKSRSKISHKLWNLIYVTVRHKTLFPCSSRWINDSGKQLWIWLLDCLPQELVQTFLSLSGGTSYLILWFSLVPSSGSDFTVSNTIFHQMPAKLITFPSGTVIV